MAEKDSDQTKKGASPAQKEGSVKESGTGANRFNLPQFLQETREELAKVVWPSRQQLISESAAVLLMVVFSALLIYTVDGAFGWIATRIFAS
ncbi:preprotein translocase subunit SecE [Leptolyngbya sp. FACHB-261]|uniref:preprotein translocase subunit SecE n=1 Tax=Leptolyngbya sp. FACHB-261 TaxID=2692806 RepID=UPI001684D2A3|nr:preprotein translocase subunit SecE [Leptolyngbya sp. FACHB-261]MBD2101346.1 preprotein translocase subunit SecE [Leptolyngbya sp. FACHB-261]